CSAPAHVTCALRPRTSPGGFMTISLTDSVINPPPAVGCFLRRWLCYTIAPVNCLEPTANPLPTRRQPAAGPGGAETDGRRRMSERQLRRQPELVHDLGPGQMLEIRARQGNLRAS